MRSARWRSCCRGGSRLLGQIFTCIPNVSLQNANPFCFDCVNAGVRITKVINEVDSEARAVPLILTYGEPVESIWGYGALREEDWVYEIYNEFPVAAFYTATATLDRAPSFELVLDEIDAQAHRRVTFEYEYDETVLYGLCLYRSGRIEWWYQAAQNDSESPSYYFHGYCPYALYMNVSYQKAIELWEMLMRGELEALRRQPWQTGYIYDCPACGYGGSHSEPWEYGDICPCCAYEFGVDDDFDAWGIDPAARWRKHWIETGCTWFFEEASRKPHGWNPEEQLKNVPNLAYPLQPLPPLPDTHSWQYREVNDWRGVCQIPKLTAKATDEEVQQIANFLEQEAATHHVVLTESAVSWLTTERAFTRKRKGWGK